jgi:predicted transcriptional regulator
MKYQEIPQQDLKFKIAFNEFILNSKQTIEAADAVSVFAKQKLEEKGNNSTEKEDELTKSVNKDSEALLNKFADAADAEEKALQNLIKTYGKKKVHEKLKDTLTSLQSESTPSNQSLKVKIMRYIQKTESF